MDDGAMHQDSKHRKRNGLCVPVWAKEEMDQRFSFVHVEYKGPQRYPDAFVSSRQLDR